MNINMEVIEWCARQVHQQQESALYVPYMIKAWDYAGECHSDFQYCVEVRDILCIQSLIKTGILDSSLTNYRGTPVLVNHNPVVDWREVPRLISQLVQSETLSPEEWCLEFLKIHPFPDGNGRTAAIIYNWMKGTLDHPIDLPEMRF